MEQPRRYTSNERRARKDAIAEIMSMAMKRFEKKELIKRLGVSDQCYYNYKHGKTIPNDERLSILAEAAGFPGVVEMWAYCGLYQIGSTEWKIPDDEAKRQAEHPQDEHPLHDRSQHRRRRRRQALPVRRPEEKVGSAFECLIMATQILIGEKWLVISEADVRTMEPVSNVTIRIRDISAMENIVEGGRAIGAKIFYSGMNYFTVPFTNDQITKFLIDAENEEAQDEKN